MVQLYLDVCRSMPSRFCARESAQRASHRKLQSRAVCCHVIVRVRVVQRSPPTTHDSAYLTCFMTETLPLTLQFRRFIVLNHHSTTPLLTFDPTNTSTSLKNGGSTNERSIRATHLPIRRPTLAQQKMCTVPQGAKMSLLFLPPAPAVSQAPTDDRLGLPTTNP